MTAERSLFTIAEIARALGCTRQNVNQQLASVDTDGEKPVSGQIARAWGVQSLPPRILQELAAKAQLKRYVSVTALLSEPFTRFEPAVPFSEIAPTSRDKALRLQRALLPFLSLRNSDEAKTSDFVNRGVSEYRRVFGFAVTHRHWRALFDRTIDRDNGAEEWDRPEVYVEDNPPRIAAARPISIARERGLSVLEDALASIVRDGELNVERKDCLWTKACDELQLQIKSGAHEKKIKRAILKALLASGLLGADKETLRRNFNRQWNAYCKNGGKVRDRRQDRDMRAKLPKEDTAKLVARSLDCGGRVRQAFRELRDSGELSRETINRTIGTPSDKSHIPASIARQVTPEVRRLMPLHRSEREFELRGPYVPQDYSKIAAGEVMQLDDVTLPVYYWERVPVSAECPTGLFFGRGQWILAIDVRSRMVVGHALHSDKVYNMRIVRSLLLRVHDAFGLPETLLLERGMWRTAKILKGDELSIYDTERGLREFGVRFQHRTKPRGKIIERVIGLLQNEMERLPGYAGRDEIHDRFERVQEQILAVTSGREHPSKYFLSKMDWLNLLDAILARYNRERQDGELKSSPAETWNRCLIESGTVNLGEKARFLLAHHKKPMKVQSRGIRLPSSLGGGLYYNEFTGRFAGETMLAWINPDELDAIALTTLDKRDGPYIVERADARHPTDAPDEDLQHANAQIASHNNYSKTQYRAIQDHLVRRKFRPLLIDHSTVELSAKFETAESSAKLERTRKARIVRTAHRRVRQAGIRVLVDAKSAERKAAAAELVQEALENE